ncbi:hypothetical protein ABBQ38_003412 [Trebouxia sp. C0009 RCD-2024]
MTTPWPCTGRCQEDTEVGTATAAGPLYVPWQTMSALASETGQAVKQTFSDSSISTSGHVQQGRQYHVSSNEHSDLPHNGQADQLVEDIPPSSSPDPKAVQAEVQRVKRKLVSTDAATEVVLRFNFMGSKESKAALLFVVASIIIGAAVLITEFVNKMQLRDAPYPFRRTTMYAWNVGVGSACWLLMTVSLASFVWHVLDAIRLHKNWKHRQKRNVTLIMVEGIIQWVNLMCYVIPNSMLLSQACYIASGIWFWFGFARWTCWNTIFTLFLVHAYSTRIWKQQEADNSKVSVAAIEHGFHSPAGHSKLVMDGPWTLLWPCLLLWPWFQAVIGFAWIHNAEHQDSKGRCLEPDFAVEASQCGVDRATLVAVNVIVAFAVLYFLVTFTLLVSRLRSYRKLPYTFVQVGLVYNTLQLWLRLVVMTFFVFCMVLLWLVQPGWCTSQNFSWLGLMPMQIVMTATTAVLCYAATPRTPQEHVAASAVWLQEFAWTEADKPIKLEARSSMVPKDADLARQPMFCFETMMKLLYWSCFVYDHMKEQLTPRTGFSNASSDQQQKLEGTSFTARTSLSLDTALSLYNMTDSQSFWELQQDTRCLIGWGGSTVVVAFRGTASMKNALADLQAWRIAHPPVRGKSWLGTRPLVHVGFLKSWLAGGLKLKVVNQVLEAVQQCKQRSGSDQPITVLVTGHSLGGALATLAAYDIRKQLLANKQSNSKVVCCTFAAPRTGNHAFAREYNAMVPDTWSVINDQDVVTREGKLLFLYKRPGQRVILNAAGHMMVRPTRMEASVQKTTGGQSVRHHLLTSYFHTILSVVLAQFSGLGFPDGMEGVIRLAEASPYVKDLLQTQMGMSLPEMRAFCQSDPASRSEQALPGAHLPSKGFWLIRRPSAPSTAATPRASATRMLMRKLSFKPATAAPSLQHVSDGL